VSVDKLHQLSDAVKEPCAFFFRF